MDKNLIQHLDINKIPYDTNVDLKKKTWIHRGGTCELFISPSNSEQLLCLVKYLYSNNIEFLLLGHTSNVYIRNSSNVSVVVSTKKCSKYELSNDTIICESGAGVIRMAKDMIQQGVAGFEYLTGLPGTIGAAIYNNSSCKSNSISQLLVSAEVLLEDGRLVSMTAEDMKFRFRTSIFKDGKLRGVIIKAILKAEYDDAIKLQEIAKNNDEERSRILAGYTQNLGCTVNRCFINGSMPFFYRFLTRMYAVLLRLIRVSSVKKMKKQKDFLCTISGYKKIAPYISDVNPIIFIWKDEDADKVFPLYLEFMAKIYKTDKIEIEII